MFSGAGVLLVELDSNSLDFVLFREDRKYTEPGGKCDSKCDDPINTALRELYEETAMLVEASADALSAYVDIERDDGRLYRSYILVTSPLKSRYYASNLRLLRKAGAASHFLETDKIVKIPVTAVYEAVVIDGSKEVKWNGKRYRLRKRLLEILTAIFGEGPDWFLSMFDVAMIAKPWKHCDQDGIVTYLY